MSQGFPIPGCLQHHEASFHLFTGASIQTEVSSACLLSPLLFPAEGLLHRHSTVISFLLCSQWPAACGTAGLGGERRHSIGLELNTHYAGGHLFSEGSWKVPPVTWPIETLPKKLGKDVLGTQRAAPQGIAKLKRSGP